MLNERWVEIDLYWFQGAPTPERVAQFFDRIGPVLAMEPDRRCGVSLCVGWLFDSVLYWNGDPEAVISCCQAPTYEPWTYARLRGFVAALKTEAAARGLANFHVALALMGIETQSFDDCEGWSGRTDQVEETAQYNITGKWFFEHREVFDPRFDLFFFGAPVRVPDDEKVFDGSEAEFGAYFAAKLCSLARATGLGAVVLRDHIFTRAYVRGNSHGRYATPEDRDAWTGAIIRMLATIRERMPELIVIGYSSGTSSMEEWRSHGFDLERVARAGGLDLWITQTWASAWQDYWPAHSMGFTFQLANLQANLAMLADTSCRNLFLVETFDAWEPWDSVHQYPAKVAWEIWAYSHSVVLAPDGAKRAAGFYMSWMNRRMELLPAPTVESLVGTLRAAAEDLADTPECAGPCIVYNRAGLDALIRLPGSESAGEEMDDWVSMLAKYGLPVLSVTRTEWLRHTAADSYLFPVPASLPADITDWLVERIRAGIPVLFMGQADRMDPGLRDRLGVLVEDVPSTARKPASATLAGSAAARFEWTGLQVNQRRRSLAFSPLWETLVVCLGGPVFARHRDLPVFVWETPEWGTPLELHLTVKSIGSPELYATVATVLADAGFQGGGLRMGCLDWQKPVHFASWRRAGKSRRVMLGNLETGVTGNSQFCVKASLSRGGRPVMIAPDSPIAPARVIIAEDAAIVTLKPHRIAIFDISNQDVTP
ncbi:MAG: hypothetical protein WCK47_08430 [bacterium]|nr:hypothetical protein [Candidatus Sumerlaeota bacterium]